MTLTFVLQAALVAVAWFALAWPGFLLALMAILVLGDVPLVLALRRYGGHHAGREAMPGRSAVLETPFAPVQGGGWQARVRLDGELWKAWSAEAGVAELVPGDLLHVQAVDGLELRVEPGPRTRG